jgi:malonyl-CoA O-methyltransferase
MSSSGLSVCKEFRDPMELEKKQIARQFSRAAATYDDVSQLQRSMSRRLLQRLPPDAMGTLVDFGCGTGESLIHLAQTTGLSVVGVDIAEGMIAIARKKAEALKHRLVTKPEFFVADFEQTDLKSASADFVFSNAAIQWSNLPAVLAEMQRVMRPAGQLLLSSFGPQTLLELKEAWRAIGDPWPRIHQFWGADELRHAISEAGFSVTRIESETVVIDYPTIKACFDGIKRLGATNAATHRTRGLMSRRKFEMLHAHLKKQWVNPNQPQLTFEPVYVFSRLEKS